MWSKSKNNKACRSDKLVHFMTWVRSDYNVGLKILVSTWLEIKRKVKYPMKHYEKMWNSILMTICMSEYSSQSGIGSALTHLGISQNLVHPKACLVKSVKYLSKFNTSSPKVLEESGFETETIKPYGYIHR